VPARLTRHRTGSRTVFRCGVMGWCWGRNVAAGSSTSHPPVLCSISLVPTPSTQHACTVEYIHRATSPISRDVLDTRWVCAGGGMETVATFLPLALILNVRYHYSACACTVLYCTVHTVLCTARRMDKEPPTSVKDADITPLSYLSYSVRKYCHGQASRKREVPVEVT
jgi:hypothetical protein